MYFNSNETNNAYLVLIHHISSRAHTAQQQYHLHGHFAHIYSCILIIYHLLAYYAFDRCEPKFLHVCNTLMSMFGIGWLLTVNSPQMIIKFNGCFLCNYSRYMANNVVLYIVVRCRFRICVAFYINFGICGTAGRRGFSKLLVAHTCSRTLRSIHTHSTRIHKCCMQNTDINAK